MPFNDYWIDPPAIPVAVDAARSSARPRSSLALLPARSRWLVHLPHPAGWPGWIWVICSSCSRVADAALAARSIALVDRARRRPFPTAPDSDLKSVLKGLYLQQNLRPLRDRASGRFAGGPARRLRPASSLSAQPANVDQPTQTPGVLHA